MSTPRADMGNMESESFEQLLRSKSEVVVREATQKAVEVVAREKSLAASSTDASSKTAKCIDNNADECEKVNANGCKGIIEAGPAENMAEETDSNSEQSTAKEVVDEAVGRAIARRKAELENKLAKANANGISDSNSDAGSSAQSRLMEEGDKTIEKTVETVLKKAELHKEIEVKEALQLVKEGSEKADEKKAVSDHRMSETKANNTGLLLNRADSMQTQNSSEKGDNVNSANGKEGISIPKNKSSTPSPAAKSLSKASNSSHSTSSRPSRTVSVGLLGVTVGSSTENNTSNGTFDLDNTVHQEKRRIAASSCPALFASCEDLKSKLFDDENECVATLEVSAKDDTAATLLENVKPCNKNPANDGTKADVDMLKLAAYGDFIMYPDIQTKDGQDIFLIDPTKLPKKQEFAQKKEFQEFMGCLCSYAGDYIVANIRSDKFVLIVCAPTNATAKMKAGSFLKKFYKLVKDSLGDRLHKCIIYKPEFKLKALLYVSRPFFGSSLRKKLNIVKSPQKLVEDYGLPDTILHL